MPNEIYHRSEWGNPAEQWGNVYLNADLTNELYKRASEYENSWVTDQLLNGVGTKPSIILTPTAYEDGVLNSVKPQRTLGSELVTNGNFATDSDWSKQTGWSISGGVANYDFTLDVKYIRQTLLNGGFVSGKTYRINFEITSGTAYMYINSNGGGLISLNTYSVGSYSLYTTASVNGSDLLIYGRNTGGTAFSIDNVSVKEITGADFDFTRGSSATRVNEKGLIEDVQILSGELVQNGNFEQIGSELVTNGNFATDSDWTKGASWSISNGKASSDGQSNNSFSQNGILTVGKTYKLTLDLTHTSGALLLLGAYYETQVQFTSSDSYTVFIVPKQNNLTFYASSFIGSIDNVSVKEVGQNWNISSGASIGENKLNVDAIAFDFFASQYALTNGLNYKVTLDAEVTSGDILLYTATQFGTINSNGSYTFYIISNASQIRFRSGGSGAVGSITNISVVEVTDDTDLPRINYTNFDYEDVLGDELVNYDNFTYGSGGWSLVGSKWVFDDVTSGYLVIDNFDVEVGQKYQVTVNISISSENANFKITSGNGQTQLFNYTDFADGETTFETTVTGVDGTIERLFVATSLTDNPFTLNSISIKRLTEDVVVPYSGEGSLLLEPQSTNLITYSEDFSQWTRNTTNIDIPSNVTQTNPSGGSESGFININNGVSATKFIYKSISTTSSIHTQSVFFKYHSRQWVQLLSGGTTHYANFDIQNGAVGNVFGCTATIEDYGSGWYKCTATLSSASTPTNIVIAVIDDDATSRLPNSTGTGSYYVWGAQVEALSYDTSYIPTNGSTVTRLADVCNNSGSSDLINSTEGVLYAEISALADDVTNRHITLSDGTDTNRLVLKYDNQSNVIQAFNRVSGVETAFLTASVTDITLFSKCALKFKLNDYALWIDGVEVDTDTSSTTFPSSTLNDLKFSATNSDFYGNVKCVAVFKEALTDAELQKLTS